MVEGIRLEAPSHRRHCKPDVLLSGPAHIVEAIKPERGTSHHCK